MTIQNESLEKTKRLGVGLSFIIFPLIFVFAFAGHPDLLSPRFLGPAELIQRAHGEPLLHLGHALVTLATAPLVVAALHFMRVLDDKSTAWLGFIGGALAIFGALMLAADKGALCLTMSALDTLPEEQFANMMPGLLSMYNKEGWVVLIWGLLFLPIGFTIQAIGLLKTNILSKWQSILFLIGILFIGTPDGVEIVNLTASVIIAIAFVPYGIRLIKNHA